MNLKVISTTTQGKLASWFLLSFFLFFVSVQLIVASGEKGGETFLDNLWISIPMFLAILSGIASFFTGLFSVIKSGERSLIVFLGILIGCLLILFIAGEFIFPH